jgi:hypothetical protein
MSAAEAKNSEDKKTPPEKSTALILFSIAADTTWRMFVPTFGGTALGLWAESAWHIKPWGGIAGLGIGIIITAFLVRQLYTKAYDNVK